tara:strand:- start:1351 stop:1638 length:288 start_codon:yes stop_codon:yes gene_type:complete
MPPRSKELKVFIKCKLKVLFVKRISIDEQFVLKIFICDLFETLELWLSVHVVMNSYLRLSIFILFVGEVKSLAIKINFNLTCFSFFLGASEVERV